MAITSAPEELSAARGRPDPGAARARTEELYAAHGATVRGLCRVLLRDRAEAEDAAQQAFLSAHRALLNGSQPLEPAAWLATIARNECWARVRARMREPLPTERLEDADPRADPLAETIRHADVRALWAAIEALPAQQREALLLRELGGLSYEELAGALSVSGAAVESLLFRARQRLRARLKVVYGALNGAGWADALGRLLAGGSGVAAPVAAKAVAVGVGAAVVAGGAAVAPSVLQHRSHAAPHVRHAAAVRRRTVVTVAAVRHVVTDGASRSGAPTLPRRPVFVALPRSGDGTEGRDGGVQDHGRDVGGGTGDDGGESGRSPLGSTPAASPLPASGGDDAGEHGGASGDVGGPHDGSGDDGGRTQTAPFPTTTATQAQPVTTDGGQSGGDDGSNAGGDGPGGGQDDGGAEGGD